VTDITPSSLPTTPQAPKSAAETSDAVSIPTVLAKEKVALESSIEEKNLAIEQNIEKIKRIKDGSVSLITQFNQNCGDWNNVCATTYHDALEKNNTAYEELLVTQRALYKALADAERALVAAE
jgi:hypothetical protein